MSFRAAAGLLLAAWLLACDRPAPPPAPEEGREIRRAAYLAYLTRDRLATCAGAARRREVVLQRARFEQLKQFAGHRGAGRAIWLGENDRNAVTSRMPLPPCGSGEPAFRNALSAFRSSLDALGDRIIAYRPAAEGLEQGE